MRNHAQFAAMVTLVLGAVVGAAQNPQPPVKAPPPPPVKAAPPTPAQGQPTPARPQPPAPAPPASAPPATAKPAQPAPAVKAAPRRPTPSQVVVRDRSGTPLADVRITVSGAASSEIVTDAAGTASLGTIRDGSYRLRFERDGFITLERDVTVRATQASTFEAALSFSPPSSAATPPPPEPPPPAAPVVVTVPAPRLSSVPSGPAVFVSLPDFLDKNYIGREPIKESVLACLADSTTRLLQMKEAIGEHTHADLDEALYIVAGEGTIRVGGESMSVKAGALSVIPHGVAHAIERRGRNPMMILSMLSGAPCAVSPPSDRGGNR
ncbi:MAG: carboxypeptidase regulatory-like domain-containing protein [Acidobacteriota bacterium]